MFILDQLCVLSFVHCRHCSVPSCELASISSNYRCVHVWGSQTGHHRGAGWLCYQQSCFYSPVMGGGGVEKEEGGGRRGEGGGRREEWRRRGRRGGVEKEEEEGRGGEGGGGGEGRELRTLSRLS